MPRLASLDLRAAFLFILAAIAMFRFKTSAAVTLVGCSIAGMLVVYLGFAG
jgi:hypothetical protein